MGGRAVLKRFLGVLIMLSMAPVALAQAQRLDHVAVRLDGGAGGGGGSGTVSTTGSPVAYECALFSAATTITGDTGCTWSGTAGTFTLTVPKFESLHVGSPTTAYATAKSVLAQTAIGSSVLMLQALSGSTEDLFQLQQSSGAKVASFASANDGGAYNPTAPADIRFGIDGTGIAGGGFHLVETTTGSSRTMSWGIDNTSAFAMAYGIKCYAYDDVSFTLPVGSIFAVSSTSNPQGTKNAGITATAAADWSFGNGTANDATAKVRARYFIGSGATPAVSNTSANSCGTTAATIAGNNQTGIVTVGATAGTSCTLTFADVAPTRRQCFVNNETTANLARASYTDTTHSVLAGTFVAGDVLAYQCSIY